MTILPKLVILLILLSVLGTASAKPAIGNYHYSGYNEQKLSELTIDFGDSVDGKRTGVPLIVQNFNNFQFDWSASSIRSRFALGEAAAAGGADGLIFLMHEEVSKPSSISWTGMPASTMNGPAYTIVGSDGYTYGTIPDPRNVGENAYILALLQAWHTMTTHLGVKSAIVAANALCANDGVWDYFWGAPAVTYIAANYDYNVIYHYPNTLAEANGAVCSDQYTSSGFKDGAHYINYWKNKGFQGKLVYIVTTKFSGVGSSDDAVVAADFKNAADAGADYIIAFEYKNQAYDGSDKTAVQRLVNIWNAYSGGVTPPSPPRITSWGNTKNKNVSNSITLNASEPVTFNATANQAISTWTWMNDGVSAGINSNSYTTSWNTGGTRSVTVLASNANGSTRTITWTVSVNPVNNPAPKIISWGNTKNKNVSNSITLNASESVTFNATANQAISTWTWMNDGVSAGINSNSYTTSWNTGGTRSVTMLASNANGSTKTITWTVSVNPVSNPASNTYPKIGYGGVPFSSNNSIFDHTTINKGDNKVTVGMLSDNFDDGTSGWSTIGTWNIVNGRYVHIGTGGTTRAWYGVDTYSDAMIFIQMKESALNNYLDAGNLRGDTSRASADMMNQFSLRPSSNGAHIYTYDGTWVTVNNTGTFTRSPNVDNYYIFSASGTNFKGYASNLSFADAWKNPRASGTNSIYASGNKIGFGASAGAGNTISVDNFRAIQMNGENPRTSGSIRLDYNAGAGNITEKISINATTPAYTNYTVSYRQKDTGDWVQIGGSYIGNQTLSIPGTKYQDTEINISLFGNVTSFPDLETVNFIRQASTGIVYPRYDVNEDGIVDRIDMTILSQHFNEVVSIPYPRYDVNMDGIVSIEDLIIVGQHFGELTNTNSSTS